MTIARLESELSGLLHKVAPAARRALARDIGRALRQSQQKRIAAQQNPDGSSFAPRRPQYRQQKGRIRRQMFAKLRTAKWLKVEANAGGVEVGFLRQVERIARVHQYGLRDRISPHIARDVEYPARELLGLADEDVDVINDKVITFLAL
ncbi:phage virion morphogenesis protein [Chromobacterium sinusclupearum]|uniref:Phage virion morphogenesis protein n=1 Tax=Chromobacterium sinusclupearum TaxID=2077146 RepID=A0A2K4MJA1_9NEIS|nr:phage virion morphogenesis protein [Chromobacterium sinusclupearum]POA97151.1 phage virion morphogenesis protein [Chromobacterium sinusclupearum]